MEIPDWIVKEIGRLQLELVLANKRIQELEAENRSTEGAPPESQS